MSDAYGDDLAYIHDVGFAGLANRAAPFLLETLVRAGRIDRERAVARDAIRNLLGLRQRLAVGDDVSDQADRGRRCTANLVHALLLIREIADQKRDVVGVAEKAEGAIEVAAANAVATATSAAGIPAWLRICGLTNRM